MKFVIIFSALFVVALGRPQEEGAARTITYDNNVGTDGYNYAYETSNRISASQQGVVNNAGTGNEALSVQGQYSYVGPDGVNYQLTYTADENGFQGQGEHLPTNF